MKIEVLKLEFFLPVAHWRVPFTQQNIHRSYPLPPPSTVLGMIHNVCGCKKGEVIEGINMAIVGKYEYVFEQFQLFRNLANPVKPAYKEAHIGGSMPTQVQLLGNVYLKIYLKTTNNEWSIQNIKNCFENPSVPFILGRREDIAVLENCDIIQLEERTLPFSIKEYSMWIDFETAKNNELKGVIYLLPYYYNIINNIRNFERIRCVYAEPQSIPLVNNEVGKAFLDNELPIFFLKSKEG